MVQHGQRCTELPASKWEMTSGNLEVIFTVLCICYENSCHYLVFGNISFCHQMVFWCQLQHLIHGYSSHWTYWSIVNYKTIEIWWMNKWMKGWIKNQTFWSIMIELCNISFTLLNTAKRTQPWSLWYGFI